MGEGLDRSKKTVENSDLNYSQAGVWKKVFYIKQKKG